MCEKNSFHLCRFTQPVKNYCNVTNYIFPWRTLLFTRTPTTQVEARATDERFHSVIKIKPFEVSFYNKHPNRLIVIADRDVVYSKFPIPLINRLEKHYLGTLASLSSAETAVVLRLQDWVTKFSHVNVPRHQKMRYVLHLGRITRIG